MKNRKKYFMFLFWTPLVVHLDTSGHFWIWRAMTFIKLSTNQKAAYEFPVTWPPDFRSKVISWPEMILSWPLLFSELGKIPLMSYSAKIRLWARWSSNLSNDREGREESENTCCDCPRGDGLGHWVQKLTLVFSVITFWIWKKIKAAVAYLVTCEKLLHINQLFIAIPFIFVQNVGANGSAIFGK